MTEYEHAMLVVTAGIFQMVSLLAEIEINNNDTLHFRHAELINSTALTVEDLLSKLIKPEDSTNGS